MAPWEKSPSAPKGTSRIEEIPHRIDSVEVDQAVGFDHILKGLGHLLAVDRPPAMGKDRLGRGQADPFKHGRPVDRMGGKDILADEMNRLRPEIGEGASFRAVTDGADIIDQCIEPDIGDIVGIKGNLNAPGKPLLRSGDTEIFQRGAEKAEDFISS